MFTTRVMMPENFYHDNLPCFHTLCPPQHPRPTLYIKREENISWCGKLFVTLTR